MNVRSDRSSQTAANLADAVDYLHCEASACGLAEIAADLENVRSKLCILSDNGAHGPAYQTAPVHAEDHEQVFQRSESEVRYYCRRIPNLLRAACGAVISDAAGRDFIDFLSACGSLNYGHNHPALKQALLSHIEADGISAGLDFHTEAKLEFIQTFNERILEPRGLDYKMQFPGPTGSNCVEAALKLARKVTGRHNVVAFTNAFHGMSLGALSATAKSSARTGAGQRLDGVSRLPYEGYAGAGAMDVARFEAMALDPSGGIDPVAAIILETVQGEGGLNVASVGWLAQVALTAKRLGALLIVDDIQAGCGRTGTFFSFERAGIAPDIICLAKSIGGYGLPMSLLLMRPEIDAWAPGEHNGTFRGNTHAFVTATAALLLWNDAFVAQIAERSEMLSAWCASIEGRSAGQVRRKGVGMMQGLEFEQWRLAGRIADMAAEAGVIVECCGAHDQVLKIFAPLTIDTHTFAKGLRIIEQEVERVLGDCQIAA